MYLCFPEESLKGADNTEDDEVEQEGSAGNFNIL